MKRFMVSCLVCLMLVSFVAPVFALDMPEPVDKLARGLANVASAPLEVGKQITNEWRAADVKHLSVIGGLAKGLAFTMKRAVSGIIDVLTFPVKLNEDYEPLMKPEYVFDK